MAQGDRVVETSRARLKSGRAAFDGTGFWRDATVSLSIEDVSNSPPFVVRDVPDQVATEGDAYRLVLTGNFADPDEGDLLRFSASCLPGG